MDMNIVNGLNEAGNTPKVGDIDLPSGYTFASLVKISRGAIDAGSHHRAIALARQMYHAGLWDAHSEISFIDVGELHDDVALGKRSIYSLMFGVDYDLHHLPSVPQPLTLARTYIVMFTVRYADNGGESLPNQMTIRGCSPANAEAQIATLMLDTFPGAIFHALEVMEVGS